MAPMLPASVRPARRTKDADFGSAIVASLETEAVTPDKREPVPQFRSGPRSTPALPASAQHRHETDLLGRIITEDASELACHG